MGLAGKEDSMSESRFKDTVPVRGRPFIRHTRPQRAPAQGILAGACIGLALWLLGWLAWWALT